MKARSDSASRDAQRGLFVARRDSLRAEGSSAPSRNRNPWTLAAAAFLLGTALLALSAGSAFAAAPEAPEAVAPNSEAVSATEAPLEGLLYPGQEGATGLEALTYEFLYKESASECTGAGSTTTPEGTSAGNGHERVEARISGLTAGSTYTFCLRAKNGSAEASESAPVTFRAAIPPEMPTGAEVLNLTPSSATFKAVLNPNAPGLEDRYKFRYSVSATECEAGGEKEMPETALEVPSAQGEVVEQQITGLLPGTTYTFCTFVRNAPEETILGAPVTFTTPVGPPAIGSEAATSVEAATATLVTTINPDGLSSTYFVEYVTQAQFAISEWTGATRQPLGPILLPAAKTPIPVSQTIAPLQPSTTYRFRFVASNSQGTTAGSGSTLTTVAVIPTGPPLPDGRQYELVSTNYAGEVYIPLGFASNSGFSFTEYPFRASADGNALTYVGDPNTERGTGNTGGALGNSFLVTRDATSGAWSGKALTPQVAIPEQEESNSTEYEGFSSQLTTAVLAVPENTSGLTPPHFFAEAQPPTPAGCDGLFSRSRSLPFHALFTATQTPGYCGKLQTDSHSFPARNLFFAGGNQGTAVVPEWADLLFQSPAALTPEAHLGVEEESGAGANLYVSSGGVARLVSVLPEGAPDSDAAFGAPPAPESQGLRHEFNLDNVISASGSSIVFTDVPTGRIYLRENPLKPQSPVNLNGECTVPDDACTLRVSLGEAVYWDASVDGSRIFYVENGELWQFNRASATREALVHEGIHGEPAGVQGLIGTSEDGSLLYVVAEAALTPDAEARTCAPASEGEGQEEEVRGHLPPGRGCNVYLLEPGQRPTLVAALAARDNVIKRPNATAPISLGPWQRSLASRTAQVSPDGRSMVFQSTQQLTGYDNSALSDKEADRLEVFVYQAAGGNGVLHCASCSPSGAAPSPPSPTEEGQGQTYLPVSDQPTYMPRWMSADGDRVFFVSSQALVSRDQNGVQDVYEWEREGTQVCPQATSRFGGCVFLVSGGESPHKSFFIDASASGDDVFFTHVGNIGGVGPSSGQNSLFDARVDGSTAGVAAPNCSAPSCAGAPAPVVPFQSPSSIGLEGTGNLPRKHHKKRHHRPKHHPNRRHGHKGKRSRQPGTGKRPVARFSDSMGGRVR